MAANAARDEPAILSAELNVPRYKVELLEQRLMRGTGETAVARNAASELDASNDCDSRDTEMSFGESSLSKSSPPTSNPKKRKRNFSVDEDDKILEGYNKFGNQWEQLAQWAQIGRTGSQIRSRYSRLVKHGRVSDSPAPEPPRKKRSIGPSPEAHRIPSSSPKKQATLTEMVGLGLSRKDRKDRDRPADSAKEAQLAEREEALKVMLDEIERKEKSVKVMLEMAESSRATTVEKAREAERVAALAKQQADNRRAALLELLVQQAEAEREAVRKDLATKTLQLGKLMVERRGTKAAEVWSEGELFKEQRQQAKELEARKDAADKLRRQLVKQRGVLMKQRGEDGAEKETIENDIELLALQEEMLKIQISGIKKEEGELTARLEDMKRDRINNQRRLKRQGHLKRSPFNNFPIFRDRYLLLNLLGKGGFSEVYQGYDMKESRVIACKIHQLKDEWSDEKKKNYVKHARREYKIVNDVNHPCVVGLLDLLEIDDNTFGTVLEYCEDGDLDARLKTQLRVPEKETRCIVTQLFAALSVLNELPEPVIHYDIKPANILFHKGVAKFADFGLAKIMSEQDMEDGMIELTSQGAGTYWYLPPECLTMGGSPKISSTVDVWSMGVVCYQMLFGKRPFGDKVTQQQLLQQQLVSRDSFVSFPVKPQVSEEAKDFIRTCLEPRQEVRPHVLEVRKHPFVSAYRPKPFVAPK